MENDIHLKTSIEVNYIRKPCIIVEDILWKLREIIDPGITTKEINIFCEKLMIENNAVNVLNGYREYPSSTCISVNTVAAHGIPDDTKLQKGDVVTIDLTVGVNGWHGDSAWTYIVGKGNTDTRRLIKAAWRANMEGIAAAKAGKRFGDVGRAIKKTADRYGCSVLKNYVGHGIGKKLHEDPMVLNYGEPGTGLPIVPGMVFTIEPILTLGNPDVRVLDNGWSIKTEDNSLSAQFEHTIAIFGGRTEILTFSKNKDYKDLDYPPYF